ncbi:putative ribonuclease H protein [Camellia lanceoleosa]|uniref:Ribonuclease H protein n=1 Tax=Camellia lanceoleosa TaxID=1840588 RepID=A0ACC0I473_9ERIC|nr:putative ribonuclease H protein [Camellia lanceoleosa]
MKQVWCLQQHFDMVDVGKGYYLICFACKADYLHVLLDGPWIVLGHYLTVIEFLRFLLLPIMVDHRTTRPTLVISFEMITVILLKMSPIHDVPVKLRRAASLRMVLQRAPLSNDELVLKVVDYWGVNGSWDWAKLSNWLSPNFLALLSPVVVRPGVENPDILVWKHSTHGKFTTKSAYLAIRQQNGHVEANLEDSRLIWRAQGPNRWKYFTWLARSDRLLTNSLKYQRQLAPDSSCSLCLHHNESTLHAMCDCTRARRIWQEIIPQSHWIAFFSLPLTQ